MLLEEGTLDRLPLPPGPRLNQPNEVLLLLDGLGDRGGDEVEVAAEEDNEEVIVFEAKKRKV